MKFRIPALFVVAALLFGGCGGTAAPTASPAPPTATATGGSSASTTPSPTSSATTSTTASAPQPTGTRADSPSPPRSTGSPSAIDVATVLPASVGGVPLFTTVTTVEQLDPRFFGGLSLIAGDLGVDPAEMEVAVGYVDGRGMVTVVKVPGMDAASITDVVKKGLSPISRSLGTEATPATVGGKEVLTFTATFGGEPRTTHVYVTGDTFFVIDSSATAEFTEELLTALP